MLILLIAGKVPRDLSWSDELFFMCISGYPVVIYPGCRDPILLSGRNPSGSVSFPYDKSKKAIKQKMAVVPACGILCFMDHCL